MIRTILVDVTGEFITKNSKLAGSQGSANSVRLSILFSEAWDGYTKRVIFYNARGENPVAVVLGEPDGETGRHEVPIPGEPLEFGGWLSYKLEGLDGDETPASIVLTVTDTLYVEPGNTYHTPAEPTPSQALQLNERIDAHLSDHENPHQVTKAQVGLSEADNTADMDKPLSIPQSEAMGTMLADKADKAETYTKAEIGEKLNMEAGAVASISGISNAAGDIAFEAGTGIRVTPNPAAQKLLIEATGESIPAAHGHTHEPGGSDPVNFLPNHASTHEPDGSDPLFIPRSASDIDFDNEDTGLTSTTAQEAVVELAARPVSASMMAADMQKGVPGGVAAYDDVKSLSYSGTTSGTSTALTLAQPGFTLTDGATVRIKLHIKPGMGATLNVAGTGAREVVDSSMMPVYGAKSGAYLTLVYQNDISKWVIQGDGFSAAPEIGDIVLSGRSDKGTNYLVANGAKVSLSDYPELAEALPGKAEWVHSTGNGTMDGRESAEIYRVGDYWVTNRGLANGGAIGYSQVLTSTTWTNFYLPAGGYVSRYYYHDGYYCCLQNTWNSSWPDDDGYLYFHWATNINSSYTRNTFGNAFGGKSSWDIPGNLIFLEGIYFMWDSNYLYMFTQTGTQARKQSLFSARNVVYYSGYWYVTSGNKVYRSSNPISYGFSEHYTLSGIKSGMSSYVTKLGDLFVVIGTTLAGYGTRALLYTTDISNSSSWSSVIEWTTTIPLLTYIDGRIISTSNDSSGGLIINELRNITDTSLAALSSVPIVSDINKIGNEYCMVRWASQDANNRTIYIYKSSTLNGELKSLPAVSVSGATAFIKVR